MESSPRIGAGQAQYTLCCTYDGGVVDDLIAYRFADDHVFLIPNAANTAEVVRRLRADAPDDLTITDEHEAQRASAAALNRLARRGDTSELARGLSAFVDTLLEDMRREETELFSAQVLRDDVIALDQADG